MLFLVSGLTLQRCHGRSFEPEPAHHYRGAAAARRQQHRALDEREHVDYARVRAGGAVEHGQLAVAGALQLVERVEDGGGGSACKVAKARPEGKGFRSQSRNQDCQRVAREGEGSERGGRRAVSRVAR